MEEIINHIMRRFFWSRIGGEQNFPLISWDKICSPKQVGGVGKIYLSIMNLAMGVKLIWNTYTNENQKWVKILRMKYLDLDEPIRILTMWDPFEELTI